jgi:two-component system OmpR family sensor kinase
VVGDERRLRQVVDNLLANVRTHTPAGCPARVTVGSQNGNAVVEVADEGPGIDPVAAERVFERFYRADESRSRDNGGVGLGLSIVAAITDAHGGRVRVGSRDGGGASFLVELPRQRPDGVTGSN